LHRESNIKWRKSDEERARKAVAKYNAKITRVNKKNPDIAEFQPERINAKDLYAELKSGNRQDYNRKIKELERYSRKGAEQLVSNPNGVTVTKYEYKEMQYATNAINNRRRSERKKVESEQATTRGKPIGLTRGEMGDTRTNELRDKHFNFNKIRSKKELQMYKQSLEKQNNSAYVNGKNELYKQNYLQALFNSNLPNKEYLIQLVSSIPAKTVVDTYYTEEQAQINFVYDEAEAAAVGDIIAEIWERVAGD
jgi:hypothetical protein